VRTSFKLSFINHVLTEFAKDTANGTWFTWLWDPDDSHIHMFIINTCM